MADRKLALVESTSAQQKKIRQLMEAVDGGGGPPHDGGMEVRVSKLETDLTAIKIDLAVIKANGATKTDIAELKGAIKADIEGVKTSLADAKTAIIMWVVGAIFVAQLLPLFKDFMRPATTPTTSTLPSTPAAAPAK